MKFYLGMRTWIWNMDKLHKIYKITFPCGNTYVGSTSQKFNNRYSRHRSNFKSKSPICEVSTQYKFNEVNMVEVDRIKCPMYDSKIKILEEEWKDKLNPTLNKRRAYQTKEEMLEKQRKFNQEYDSHPINKTKRKEYDRQRYKNKQK